jgi:hypothetical protein
MILVGKVINFKEKPIPGKLFPVIFNENPLFFKCIFSPGQWLCSMEGEGLFEPAVTSSPG